MRTLLAVLALAATLQARAECTPAAPAAIAEAERQAGEAERKADQAESVSVRSGNPGAARRAELARREASEARARAAALACKPAPAAAVQTPVPSPGRGY